MKDLSKNRHNVYVGTMEDIEAGEYIDSKGKSHSFDLVSMLNGTKFYQKVKKLDDKGKKFCTKIYAQKIDCIQKAYDFGKDGALLNMASRFKPGGGVLNGAASQEEDIFRRTTLSYSLYHFINFERYNFPYKYTSKVPVYPIKGDKSAIWSPGVEIYRKSSKGYYDHMSTPGITNVISVPGIKNPELTEDGKFKENHAKMWRNKIRTVLRLALINEKYKLVLGAWGCGAYNNPPRLIAELFKEILAEPEFENKFEEICFAILEDSNSPKGGNYSPFAEVFGHK